MGGGGGGGGPCLCGVAPRCDIPRGRACVFEHESQRLCREGRNLCQEPTGSIGVG